MFQNIVYKEITVKPVTKVAGSSITTSTLQPGSFRKLGFSVAQTMAVAQKLYEAGKITYMKLTQTSLSGCLPNRGKLLLSRVW